VVGLGLRPVAVAAAGHVVAHTAGAIAHTQNTPKLGLDRRPEVVLDPLSGECIRASDHISTVIAVVQFERLDPHSKTVRRYSFFQRRPNVFPNIFHRVFDPTLPHDADAAVRFD
jgi:hypothetical protein